MADKRRRTRLAAWLRMGISPRRLALDPGAGLRHRVPAGGGNSDGNLRGGSGDVAVERAGDSGCELCSDAFAADVDAAVCSAGRLDVRIGTAAVVGENAVAWVADADVVGFRECSEPGYGGMAGDCGAGSGSDDPGVDAGVAEGSGAGADARGIVGPIRIAMLGCIPEFRISWGAHSGDI